jgi:hypothetical protein
VGTSGPDLVQSWKEIINEKILIGFGSFRESVRDQSTVCREKSVIIAVLHELVGRTLGVTSAGDEANIAPDSIK